MESTLNLAADFAAPSRRDWLDAVEGVLRGKDFDRTLVTTTADGIDIQPLYTSADTDTSTDPAGLPGFSLFERGASLSPRPHGMWDIRAVVDHPDIVAANAAALRELNNGATSIELVLDLAGTGNGVSIRSITELAAVLDGVLADVAPVSIRAGAHAGVVARWLTELFEDSGVTPAGGDLGLDPLGTLTGTGVLPQGLDGAWAEMADVMTSQPVQNRSLRPARVSSVAVHNAGATDAQELAWLLAAGTDTLRALSAQGIPVTDAASQLTFDLTADVDVFATVAKLRALRWAWSSVLTESGLADVGSGVISITARSAWRSLTTVDPWGNLLRGTAATFGAVIGGADAVVVAPFDGGDERGSPLGSRMARNTQLLLQDESGLGRVCDPAGGSWFIESLTEQLLHAAWSEFQRIERQGGATNVVFDGSLRSAMEASSQAQAQRVADRRHPITGVTEFPLLDETRPEPPSAVPPDDRAPVTIPGQPTTAEPLVGKRLSEPFEALRRAAAAADQRPTVWLATLGPVASHTARASFATNLFATGGIATASDSDAPTDNPQDVAAAFSASGLSVACICGADADYASSAGQAALALTQAGATKIYLAGRPGEYESAWRDAGIDSFIAIGTDVLSTMTELHHHLGLS